MADRQQFAPPKALHVLEELADRYDSDKEFWTRSAEILMTVHEAADEGYEAWGASSIEPDAADIELNFHVPGEVNGVNQTTRPYDLQLRPPPPNVGTRAALLVSGLMFVGSILLAVLTG